MREKEIYTGYVKNVEQDYKNYKSSDLYRKIRALNND